MGIKISDKDNTNMIVMEFERDVSFRQSIKDFATNLNIPLREDGSIHIEHDSKKYIMISHKPSDSIEIGYFNVKPDNDFKVLRKSSNQNDTIAVTFNFSANYTQQVNGKDSVRAKGVVNSLIVNNFDIFTSTCIAKGENFHALVVRYKKDLLRQMFGDVLNFKNNILESKQPIILFSDQGKRI